jgi:membrane-associated phospholipid phosphatase
MLFIAPMDFAWTHWLVKHNYLLFSNFINRTIFEGSLPGTVDFVLISQVAIAVLFVLAWTRPQTFHWLQTWRPRLGFMTFYALIYGVFFVYSTKWIWGRFRPNAVVSKGHPYSDWFELGPQFIGDGVFRGSFPSGHVAIAFLLMSLAYVLAGTAQTRRQRFLGWWLGALVVINSLAVAVGRAMIGSHWLSDCVASIAVGWVLLHLIYHWGLHVPEQCRYADHNSTAAPRPALWELHLSVNAFWASLGFWGCGIGLRALAAGRSIWMVFLIPLWLALMFYGTVRLRRLGLFAPFNSQSASRMAGSSDIRTDTKQSHRLFQNL